MLFYFFNVCCLCCNGNTSRRSLCWQLTDCGSPAPHFLISCQGAPSAPHPSPCPAHWALQRAGVLHLQQKTCSALCTMLLLLCRLLAPWGRKSQTCFGPKTSKMMSKIPFFLVLSICLLIHCCLTKTMISNWVGLHRKEYFFVESLKAQKEQLS